MNAMANAMKTAGVKTPTVMYRIWNWLKDHPMKTAEDVTKALGSSYHLGSTLWGMERRGMVVVFKDKSRKTGIRGVEYMLKRYSVKNAATYELVPLPSPKKQASAAKEAEFNRPMVEAAKQTYAAPKKDVLTEAEKFAAYLEFKALMKEMTK